MKFSTKNNEVMEYIAEQQREDKWIPDLEQSIKKRVKYGGERK
jgi:hypothetical protein